MSLCNTFTSQEFVNIAKRAQPLSNLEELVDGLLFAAARWFIAQTTVSKHVSGEGK